MRLLNAIACPPKQILTATTIAAFLVGRDSARYGLIAVAEMMGHTGTDEAKRKFAQRALNDYSEWQVRNGINLGEIRRGQRNLREVTLFGQSNLNAATFWVEKKLESKRNNIPSIAEIDRHAPSAVAQFLRRPLAVVPRRSQSNRPSALRTRNEAISLSVNELSPSAQCALNLVTLGFRVFPVDATKRPLIWHYVQSATRNKALIFEWSRRWPKANWAILCGVPMRDGGYLTVIDKDRHPGKFGDGFQTALQRSLDLGRLPATLSVRTGGGGAHEYFRSRQPIPTSSDSLGPGLDCKSSIGWVVGPGSFHQSGCQYEIVCDLPIAWLPLKWEKALASRQKVSSLTPVNERHSALRAYAWAKACEFREQRIGQMITNNDWNELQLQILSKLRELLMFNCEKGDPSKPRLEGGLIPDTELVKLAESAIKKVRRAREILDRLVV